MSKKRKGFYPYLLCADCAEAAGCKLQTLVSTFYPGVCEVCGETKTVTEARDYGDPWFAGVPKGITMGWSSGYDQPD